VTDIDTRRSQHQAIRTLTRIRHPVFDTDIAGTRDRFHPVRHDSGPVTLPLEAMTHRLFAPASLVNDEQAAVVLPLQLPDPTIFQGGPEAHRGRPIQPALEPAAQLAPIRQLHVLRI
jgi:hypothetical protein